MGNIAKSATASMRTSKLKIALLDRRELQYELAARAGINETRLSRIVQGRAKPTDVERKRIAEALGVAEGVLFTEESNQSSRTSVGND